MKNTEIYIYTRKELEENSAIMNEKIVNKITYKTENVIGNIYLPNSNVKVGKINYINNLVISDDTSFNTSIGTIVTKNGSIVFNFNYILNFSNSRPNVKNVFSAKPTYTSGVYDNYNNLTITVQILELTGERIIAIEYD